MAALSSSASAPHVLRRILKIPPLAFFSSHCLSTRPRTRTAPSSISRSVKSLLFIPSPASARTHSLSFLTSQAQAPISLEEHEEEEEPDAENETLFESGSDGDVVESGNGDASARAMDSKISIAHEEMVSKLRGMSVKEKKELAAYAHSLGKKLKSQQVGKSGVTASVATALAETLEANELLKLKIHSSCPGELNEVVKQLEEATGSVVVGRIGRAVIIYRPSLTKLKATEKKKQAQKIFLQRSSAFKSSLQNRGRKPVTHSRGRGGIQSP